MNKSPNALYDLTVTYAQQYGCEIGAKRLNLFFYNVLVSIILKASDS